MTGHRAEVNSAVLHVHIHMACRLHSIGMEYGMIPFAKGSNFFHRIDSAQLIIYPHDRNSRRTSITR